MVGDRRGAAREAVQLELELHPPEAARTVVHRSATAELAARVRRFRRRLERLLGDRPLALALTDNRSTALTARRRGDRIHLRIHRGFLEAPDEVLAAVATFVLGRSGEPRARLALHLIREHFSRVRQDARSIRLVRNRMRPVGRTHDLREVRDALLERYFRDRAGRLALPKVPITWGNAAAAESARQARNRRRGTYSIKLGSYSFEDRVIRVHPALDSPSVPRYVLESVVYHELLHADIPPVLQNGRRLVHTAEFRRRERRFREYARAERWIAEHLHELAHGTKRKRSGC